MCVAKVYHFINTYNQHPKQYINQILDLSKTDKDLSLAYLVFNVLNMSPDQAVSPKGVNKKLANEISFGLKEVTDAVLSSAKQCETYLTSHDMSKALGELTDEGLLLNIRGKENIKKYAPQVLSKQTKGAPYDDNYSKPEGYYSIYKISDNLMTLRRVISNPYALEFIYNKLKKYGILQKYYDFMVSALIYTLIESDEERFYQFITIAVQPNFDNQRIHPSKWKEIKQYLSSLKEEELNSLMKEMVTYQLDKPVDHNILLLYILG